MRHANHTPPTEKTSQEGQSPTSNQRKDPADWVTGEEPMTGPQASYLKTLCQQVGETFDDTLSKAEASRRIDALRERAGLTQAQPNNEPS